MPNQDKHVTIKIWTKTRRLAKIVSAVRNEPLVYLFHRLVTNEAQRAGIDVEAITGKGHDNNVKR